MRNHVHLKFSTAVARTWDQIQGSPDAAYTAAVYGYICTNALTRAHTGGDQSGELPAPADARRPSSPCPSSPGRRAPR
jgi:hypothetical protein